MSKDETSNMKAEVVKGAVELAGRAYEDALQGPAREIGRSLTAVGKTLNVALAPLRGLVWGWERIEVFVAESLERRLAEVASERLQTPDPTVAGPVLEALRFAGENPDLREMYANLLATAMDADSAHLAHPSFPEVVRQLNADEAKLVRLLYQRRAFATVTVRSLDPGGPAGHDVLSNFTVAGVDANCSRPDLVSVYVENLDRLKVARLRPDYTLSESALYDRITAQDQYRQAIAAAEKGGRRSQAAKGSLLLTDFGLAFCFACVDEERWEASGVIPDSQT